VSASAVAMVASGLAVACFGWCLLSHHAPIPTPRPATSFRMTADDDAPSAKGGDLINPGDLEKLRARISRIQESGGALETPSQKLFELATAKPPSIMLRDFFATASPMVQQGMQDAVVSLLGALPPFEFDSQVTTTGDKMAALMLQLQMTGYMLRNAEYVLTLRKLLGLSTRSAAEYRQAFDKLDLDGSGTIERGEISALLEEIYEGTPPEFEVDTFMKLFDANDDGVVSWEEFATTLGVTDWDADSDSGVADLLGALLPAADEDAPTLPSPSLEGKVTVELGDGNEVEVDASAYVGELKDEAQSLRLELARLKNEEKQREAELTTSISAYVGSLPEAQLKTLTAGISEEVVGAMRMLVEYILKTPGGERQLEKDEQVTIEQEKLQQLCLYQLVLGYNLRESEAKGDAEDMIGR